MSNNINKKVSSLLKSLAEVNEALRVANPPAEGFAGPAQASETGLATFHNAVDQFQHSILQNRESYLKGQVPDELFSAGGVYSTASGNFLLGIGRTSKLAKAIQNSIVCVSNLTRPQEGEEDNPSSVSEEMTLWL